MDRLDLLIVQSLVNLSISSLSLEEEKPGENLGAEEGVIIQCVLTDWLVLMGLWLLTLFFLLILSGTQDNLVTFTSLLSLSFAASWISASVQSSLTCLYNPF